MVKDAVESRKILPLKVSKKCTPSLDPLKALKRWLGKRFFCYPLRALSWSVDLDSIFTLTALDSSLLFPPKS